MPIWTLSATIFLLCTRAHEPTNATAKTNRLTTFIRDLFCCKITTEIQMRHNKIIGWDRFLGVVEQVQKFSPWLSRQIAKRASEWPFWYSGLTIKEWQDRQAWVELPQSFRNSVDNEITQGHLVLGAELSVRLVLLRLRQEFPFS